MAKRDLAFELFDRGKMPKDPELEALGLKKESLRKYFREWKEQAQIIEEVSVVEEAPVVVEEAPTHVLAGTLKPGEEFELRSSIYRAGVKDGDFLMTSIPTQPQLGVQVVGVNEMVKPTRRLSPSDHT